MNTDDQIIKRALDLGFTQIKNSKGVIILHLFDPAYEAFINYSLKLTKFSSWDFWNLEAEFSTVSEDGKWDMGGRKFFNAIIKSLEDFNFFYQYYLESRLIDQDDEFETDLLDIINNGYDNPDWGVVEEETYDLEEYTITPKKNLGTDFSLNVTVGWDVIDGIFLKFSDDSNFDISSRLELNMLLDHFSQIS